MKAIEVYVGSDGEATKAFYAALCARGPIGHVAMNLFRAQKCSARAKVYRGAYKGRAYERKDWSLGLLCGVLVEHAESLELRFGWREDAAQECHKWVLYVELPGGQVSFHSARRGVGPTYEGKWDGLRLSAERILVLCDVVMMRAVVAEQETLFAAECA
jgi:hypothetical protein